MKTVLRVQDLTKNYQGRPVIENISLEVGQGEIVALTGQSGVGKSTLFNLIAGISRPDEGKVWLNSEDITGKSGKISYMQQKDLLLPYKTVLENVALPLLLAGCGKTDYAALLRENSGDTHFTQGELTITLPDPSYPMFTADLPPNRVAKITLTPQTLEVRISPTPTLFMVR